MYDKYAIEAQEKFICKAVEKALEQFGIVIGRGCESTEIGKESGFVGPGWIEETISYAREPWYLWCGIAITVDDSLIVNNELAELMRVPLKSEELSIDDYAKRFKSVKPEWIGIIPLGIKL